MARWPKLRVWVLMLLMAGVSVGQSSAPVVPGPAGTAAVFRERETSFSSGGIRLSATFTLPETQNGSSPGVLFVGGREPNSSTNPADAEDMFADLARGMAEAGIASLRYEQRPFEFSVPPDSMQLPLDRQITNDAVAGLQDLRHRPEIDPSMIFVIGCNVGGIMAPYISDRFREMRGMVLMAAAARSVEEVLAERRKTALQAKGMSSQEVLDQVAAQNKILADIRSGKVPSTRVFEGATVAYWRDRMNRDPGLKIRNLEIPVLILQGGQDNEVTEADYDRLETILKKKRGATPEFRWFPNLDHLFMRPSVTDSASSVKERGRVDPLVIQTITNWIKSQVHGSRNKR